MNWKIILPIVRECAAAAALSDWSASSTTVFLVKYFIYGS